MERARTNENVQLGTKRSLLTDVMKSRFRFFGHARKAKGLAWDFIAVIIQEEREEVDPCEKYANNIRDWICLSLGAAIRKTDRE